MHFNFCSCAPVSFRNNDCITYSQSGYDSILSLIPLHADIAFSKISNRGDTQKTLVVCMKHNSKIQSFDKQNDVTDRESYTWKRVSMIRGEVNENIQLQSGKALFTSLRLINSKKRETANKISSK